MKRPIFSFVSCACLIFTLGAFQKIEAQTAHPRLNLDGPNGKRLAALKASAASNSPRWVALKKAADAALAAPTIGNVSNLGLAYLVTGDPKYGTAGVTAVMAEASQPAGAVNVSTDSWYNMRNTYMGVVRGLDWLYPVFTPAQRAQVAAWLMDTAALCWNRPGGWALNNSENNYWWGFCYTGMAGLACLGDEPRAQSEVDRWKGKLDNQAISVFAGNSRGGQWIESSSYGLYNSNMAAVQIDAYQTALGVDIVTNSSVGSFLREVCNYTLHGTTPDYALRWPFGDQSRSSMPGIMDYDRDAVLPAAAIVGGQTQSDVKQWLSLVKQPGMAVRAWSEFLWFPEAAPTTDYRLTSPNSYFVPGAGTFFYRQSWTPAATMWSAWSGPMNQSHQFPEANGFQLYKAGWLLPMAPVLSQSGIVGSFSGGNPDTQPFNAVTVSGHPQTQFGFTASAKGGATLVHEVGVDYVAWEGQAAPCYYYRDASKKVFRSATDAVRKVLCFTGQDTFLVVDRVTKVLASDTIEQHWHTQKQPVLNGSVWSADNGKYIITGSSFGGAVKVTAENYGQNGATSSYRTDVTSAPGSATDTLLTVLQVTPLGTAANICKQSISAQLVGVQAGQFLLLAGKTEGVQGSATFSVPDSTSAVQCVVCDLQPNVAYAPWGQTSASGVLRFTVPQGSASVTLTPSGSPPPPPPPPPPVTLQTVSVGPAAPSIVAGGSVQLAASGVGTDGNLFALGAVVWSTNGGAVDQAGVFSSQAAGKFTVTATSAGVSGSVDVVVTPAQIDWQAKYNAEFAAHQADLALLVIANGSIVNLNNQLTAANAMVAQLTGNVAAVVAQRDALQAKYDKAVADIKAALGIP